MPPFRSPERDYDETDDSNPATMVLALQSALAAAREALLVQTQLRREREAEDEWKKSRLRDSSVQVDSMKDDRKGLFDKAVALRSYISCVAFFTLYTPH